MGLASELQKIMTKELIPMNNIGELRKYEFDNMKQDASYPAWIQYLSKGTGPQITDNYNWQGNKDMAKAVAVALALQGLVPFTGKAIQNAEFGKSSANTPPPVPEVPIQNIKSPEMPVELTPHEQRINRLNDWLETGKSNDPHLNGNDQGIAIGRAKLYSDETGRALVQSPVSAKKSDWVRAYADNHPEIDKWWDTPKSQGGGGPGAANRYTDTNIGIAPQMERNVRFGQKVSSKVDALRNRLMDKGATPASEALEKVSRGLGEFNKSADLTSEALNPLQEAQNMFGQYRARLMTDKVKPISRHQSAFMAAEEQLANQRMLNKLIESLSDKRLP